MATVVKDTPVQDRDVHGHDWCEIPLHEDCCICALCGEVREAIPAPSWWDDAPDGRHFGESLLTFSI